MMTTEIFSAVLQPIGLEWEVAFPLFPNVRVMDQRRKYVVQKAKQALEQHLVNLAEAGETIPTEGVNDEPHLHASDGTTGDHIPIFIEVKMPILENERVNVYLPKRLIGQIDEYATSQGMNRSSVFGDAAAQYLKRETGIAVDIGTLGRELVRAAERAAKLPYKVEFEISSNGAFVVRGIRIGNPTTGLATGCSIPSLFSNPKKEIDQAFSRIAGVMES